MHVNLNIHTVVFGLMTALFGLLIFYINLQKKLLKTHIKAKNHHLPLDPIVLPCHEYKIKTTALGKKIALVSLTPSPEAEQFIGALQEFEELAYPVDTYVVGSSGRTMDEVVREVLERDYALIYTIGHHATERAKELSMGRQKLIPIVFSSIYDKWWADSQARSVVYHITGVTYSPNLVLHNAFIPDLCPDAKRILLVADPRYDITETITQIYAERGVTVSVVGADTPHELLTLLAPALAEIDVLILLENSCGKMLSSHLSNVCREKKIIFISSIISDAHEGAAISCGLSDISFGRIAAEKALAILDQHVMPDKVGLSHVSAHHSYELHCNHAAMEAQGLAHEAFVRAAQKYGLRLFIKPSVEESLS